MKNDYLILDGEKCRIEFNWNAVSDFLEENGLELSAMDQLVKMKPSQITNLIHHALIEGARLDKKEYKFSSKDVGSVLSITDVSNILIIFQSHVNKKNTGEEAKKKTLFSRRK